MKTLSGCAAIVSGCRSNGGATIWFPLGAVRIAERELQALGEEVAGRARILRRGLVRLLGRQDDRGDPAAVLRQSRDCAAIRSQAYPKA